MEILIQAFLKKLVFPICYSEVYFALEGFMSWIFSNYNIKRVMSTRADSDYA